MAGSKLTSCKAPSYHRLCKLVDRQCALIFFNPHYGHVIGVCEQLSSDYAETGGCLWLQVPCLLCTAGKNVTCNPQGLAV